MKEDDLIKRAATFWLFSSQDTFAKNLLAFLVWSTGFELVGYGWGMCWAYAPWPTIILTVPVISFLCTLPVFFIRRRAERELKEMGYKSPEERAKEAEDKAKRATKPRTRRKKVEKLS